jgi:hypothetical protein
MKGMNALITDAPDSSFAPETFPEKLDKPRPSLEWLATPSQEAGLDRLNQLADVFFLAGAHQHAGFRPLTRSLMVGESGSGKSRLANEFARQRDYQYLPVDCGSWTPQGSLSRPQTLVVIRDHIRANRGRPCVVYLDEVDKLLPSNAESSASSWVLGCWSEFLALADGCSRLRTHDWHEQDIRGLGSCLLLAGGAFTAANKEARRCSKQGGLGFQSPGIGPALVTHADKIREQLPVEVYSRFHRTLIILEVPTRDDYATAIDLIHFELSVSWPRPINEILDEAEASGAGLRWVESYLADLLVAHPGLLKPKEEEAKPAKRPGYDFFTPDTLHYGRQITDYSFELRGALGRLTAELIARQGQISRSRNTSFKDFLYGPDGQRLLSMAKNARLHSNACGDISDDDSQVTAALVGWAEEAWAAMYRFPAELNQFGLMPMFSRTWDLAFRVSELRTRISTGVAMGRYGHQP